MTPFIDLRPGRVHVSFDPDGHLRSRLFELHSIAIVIHPQDCPSEALATRIRALRRCGMPVVVLFQRECAGFDWWKRHEGVRELAREVA